MQANGASSGRAYTLVDLSTGKAVASSRNKRVRFTATLNRSYLQKVVRLPTLLLPRLVHRRCNSNNKQPKPYRHRFVHVATIPQRAHSCKTKPSTSAILGKAVRWSKVKTSTERAAG